MSEIGQLIAEEVEHGIPEGWRVEQIERHFNSYLGPDELRISIRHVSNRTAQLTLTRDADWPTTRDWMRELLDLLARSPLSVAQGWMDTPGRSYL